jgi:hypothetical protein
MPPIAMNYIRKMYAPYLARWRRSYFRSHILRPEEHFAGKSVLLIGAAECAIEEIQAVDLREFDIIARTNRAIDVPLTIDGQALFRHEALFHNLQQNGPRSAGTITPGKLSRNGTTLIVYPYGPVRRFKKALKAIRTLEGVTQLRMVDPNLVSRLEVQIGRKCPTTGFVAINVLARSNCRKLHIVGFTFFETKFLPDYNPATESVEEARNWAHSVGWHDPQAEKNVLRTLLLSDNNANRITLGAVTKKTLQGLTPHPETV